MKTISLYRPKIEIADYKVNAQGLAPIIEKKPDRKSIKRVVRHISSGDLKKNIIIIARNHWLRIHKLPVPPEDRLYNLCVQIRDGRVIRSFYSDTMLHLLKKLNYKIVILN